MPHSWVVGDRKTKDSLTAPKPQRVERAHKRIKGLVVEWATSLEGDIYGTNGTQARREFINPFFVALGWEPLPT